MNKADSMNQRKIYDCANPVYESYDNIKLDERVMYSLEEIIKNARKNTAHR